LIQQSGFSGVGISDQRDDRDIGSFPPGAMLVPVSANFLKLILEISDPPANISPVNLQLGFTWSPQSNSST
jgi:hypothetical protein